MSIGIAHEKTAGIAWREILPWVIAAVVYVLLLAIGSKLLADPDTYWHVTVGRWILDHGQVPQTDVFSFTASGRPWIAQEWLSEIIFAGAANLGGWTGVVALTAAVAALCFGLLAHWLAETLAPRITLILVAAAFMLATPHLIARPHVLAWVPMILWVGGVIRAVDRRQQPPLMLLPVMVIWANLHGSFTLGLVFALAAGLEATASAAANRRGVAMAWARFVLLAVIAGGVTPYGFEALLTTWRILSLGSALSVIGEWRPADFSQIGALEIALLGSLVLALLSGFKVNPVRALMLAGIVHLALSAARNDDVLGWLAPILLAAPLAAQFADFRPAPRDTSSQHRVLAVVLLLLLVPGTAAIVTTHQYSPPAKNTPAAAVAALQAAGSRRVLNDYDFGGYLIASGVPTFIDGRTELFGAQFLLRYLHDVQLKNIPDFLKLLDEQKIDATMLTPSTPAVGFLDRDPGWKRIFADDTAVVHIRLPIRGTLN